jgi:hypothetical protein
MQTKSIQTSRALLRVRLFELCFDLHMQTRFARLSDFIPVWSFRFAKVYELWRMAESLRYCISRSRQKELEARDDDVA